MSRDQRRAALKEILKDYENGGFNPNRFLTVFGLVRELVEILSDRANARRMSDAGALVTKVYDASPKVHGRPQELACKKGCGCCCHVCEPARLCATVDSHGKCVAEFVGIAI